MSEKSLNEKEIKEIYLHVTQLKAEKSHSGNLTKDGIDSGETIHEKTEPIKDETLINDISPVDLFEVTAPIDESDNEREQHIEETVSKMKLDMDPIGVCDICKKDFLFETNLAGLTAQGKFFVCKDCCKEVKKDELDYWAKSKMTSSEKIKPIALWIMEKKNKT